MSDKLSTFEYFVCGGFAGICVVLVGHPMDTVKVRLQTTEGLYTGTWDCIRKTVRNEGVLGLYKGMSTPLTAITPIFALSFMGYGIGKKIFKTDIYKNSMPRIFGAGAFSGLFITVLNGPAERIKGLLQIQHSAENKKYSGPIDCIKQLYKEGGIKNIYRGTLTSLARDMPASGIYFMTYQVLSDYLTTPGDKPGTLATIFAGGMAGITHWLVGLPADVLKNRLQTAPKGKYENGIRDVISELMRTEGPFALYKGLTPVMLRAFPANAVCFLGFEVAAEMIHKLHKIL